MRCIREPEIHKLRLPEGEDEIEDGSGGEAQLGHAVAAEDAVAVEDSGAEDDACEDEADGEEAEPEHGGAGTVGKGKPFGELRFEVVELGS